ncbi:DUF4837 family protein [Mangrovibacterium marinum]|uniref:Uncharacterized protein DUF4837 n=1 Tax=Mangrovibacterium marinum TaxID=1639118 RepID=A0A2T5C691_9BACT|nr:DUF4837 family protein [Mangrovibacterium marinum]PTN10469.1 uncharacterized protein DUF4837 [Mangrovibacterium marinum]
MKRISLILFTLIGLGLFISSCKDDTKLRKKITGKAGEVVVVIPNESWNSSVGESIRKTLAQAQLSLPQEEPLFDLVNVPPAAFKDIFKSNRNIINVRISPGTDTTRVEFKKDIWAWPQAVINISAKNNEDFNTVFNQNSDKIVAYLLKAERDRLMMNYAKYNEKKVEEAVKKNVDVKLTVPVGYQLANQGADFTWARYDPAEALQGIAVYSFPYVSDSTFTAKYLVAKRDSVLKQYIDGPTPGSYMITEHRLDPTFTVFEYKNNYAAEMRGLWRVENDFMGGPYVSLAVLDAANNRVVVAEGFVYAPRYDKRNYLRQVEAIVYSLALPDQAKNDKIKSQIEMGN